MSRVTEVPSLLGPIPVVYVDDLVVNGVSCFGAFDADTRTIKLCSGLPPMVEWQTLWHEWLHSALHDTGAVHVVRGEKRIEVICDALGTALAKCATFTE